MLSPARDALFVLRCKEYELMDKVRSDSWYAGLTEEEMWQIFDETRHKNYVEGLDVVEKVRPTYSPLPGRSAWYRWLDFMREKDQQRKVERAAQSAAEAAAMAKGAGVKDEVLVEAYKTMAADLALRTGDSEAAERFTRMAMSIADRSQKRKELDLKAAAQKTKDDQLALARDKFEAAEKRLAAATETVADKTLTDEERVAKMKEIFGLK